MSSGSSFDNDNGSNKPPLINVKKNLTLDLPKSNSTNMSLPLSLLSPDLNLIKVDTPELMMKVDTPTIENIILANNMTNTPSPSLLFPRNVTVEQETFAGGFVEALNNLHNNGSDSNASTIYDQTTCAGPFLPQIKEEPQIVPNVAGGVSPPMSPVDMEYQERMKLERKRQRNRIAASKCRSRKLERISKLEDKVKLLKNENSELGAMINQLKETVGLVKLEVMQHVNAGCPIMQQYSQ